MGSKEKTKAEILEENKKLAEEVSALKKEVNVLRNGGNELTYTFKFSSNNWAKSYLEELKTKTKLVYRRYHIDDNQTFKYGMTETREWPDGNRVVIEHAKIGVHYMPSKITFFDVIKGKPNLGE